jgi:hypothetical protein
MGSQTNKCECYDKECSAHKGTNCKRESRTKTLYRIDMEDKTGTRFCDDCESDALESGLYDYRRNFATHYNG